MRIRPLILALAGIALLSACKESPSDAAFGARVHAYLLKHPETLREMADALDKKDAAQASQKQALALRDNRSAIEHDPRDFVAHPAGKITVVQFFDYNCTYCKVAAPQVLDIIAKNPDVRFVFKELPVIGGPPSMRAARIALAVQKQKGDYLSLYGDFIAAHPLDDATANSILVAHGLNPEALEAEATSSGVDQHLAETKTMAQTLGIDGTPAFVIGDRIISGANIPALKEAIEKARKA